MGKASENKLMARLRQFWHELSGGRPGRRFQDRYRRRQKDGDRRMVWRVINIILGVVLVALSAVGGLLPILGWGTAIIGFALIAGEVLYAAWLLDKSEDSLRKFPRFCRDVWNTANLLGKALILVLLTALTTGLLYLLYVLIQSIF